MELYKKYRPKTFAAVVGQDNAVAMLDDMVKKNNLPHAILFTGPSGTGKTTIARILRRYVKCGIRDFQEMNCADIRGIDAVRDIRKRMSLRPLAGKSKIWLIDEAHKLTNDAQNALLKMLEDTPKHVYFFICTTDPNKLIRTIRTRPLHVALTLIKDKEITQLVKSTAKAASYKVTSRVCDTIAEAAGGSARLALNLLEGILHTKTEKDALQAIQDADGEVQAIQLCRLLLNPNVQWKPVADLLKQLAGQEPESLRRMMLGYMNTIILSGGKLANRAFNVASIFENNFYDTGKVGLTLACYDVVNGK